MVKLLKRTRKRNLITYTFPESKISEEFRTIRTNVHFVTEGKKHTVILITSPKSGEGKSTTAANLAVSMAQQDEKVLLIDANLRRPAVHLIFKLPNSGGLTEVLTGNTQFEEAVTNTEIGKLDILSSGTFTNNPAELLASQAMKELLQKAAQVYDIVIIDSAPVLDLTDTKLFASQCDGVLLVLSQGNTQIEDAAEAKKALEFAKGDVSGVILNEM
ncbi:CpsD/CapB family tyrosine-protein kinase [Niallia oryzisoli]|uniref:non-specific protein-tyrosine kinase n=1 Tax=Niallia oryzisoli TaxID=1737571 RepID=A0ABZ2CEI7_9BACI